MLDIAYRKLPTLWALAVQECERRFAAQKEIRDRNGISKDKRNDLLQKCAVSPFALNYWLNDIDKLGLSTDICRQLMVKLAGAYKSYFELKKKKDRKARVPAAKDEGQSCVISFSLPRIEKGGIRLTLGKQVSVLIPLDANGYLANMIEGKKLKYVTLKHVREEDRLPCWKINVTCAYEAPPQKKNPTRFRAIDLGAGDVALSEVTVGHSGYESLIPMRRPDKHWIPLISEVEDRVAKCTKGSRAYNRRMKARRKMYNVSSCQCGGFQRKLASALTKDVDVIIVSKAHTRLGLAQSAGTADQHRGVQNTGYMFRLLIYIKEKAVERGVRFIEIPDPERKGDIEDPQSKFHASRILLAAALPSGVCVSEFKRRNFQFAQ